MKTNLMITILAIAIIFTNCKKDAGPKGEKGDKGEQGIQGNNGVSGIINTTLYANSWAWDNSTKTRDVFFTNIPSLTQNIINNGAIMVYEDFGSNQWVPLPETFLISSGVTYNVMFSYSLNYLYISKFLSDESDPGSNSATFRLVVIPPALIKPNINMHNYAEVKASYNLKD